MDLLSPWHLLIILVIVVLIFGPNKLGDVGGALGKAIKDFKKAMSDVDEAVKPTQKSSESASTQSAPQENKPVQPS
jgi:sec-independent protein translocase protein TatA